MNRTTRAPRSPDRRRAGIAALSRLADLPRDACVTVVRTGGLGDTILVLPTLAILRAAFPAGGLTLVGSTWAEALGPLMPFPVRILHVDHAFPAAHRDGPKEGSGSSPVSASHAVIVYTARPESDFVAHIRGVCRGTVRVHSITPPEGIHAARHLAHAVADPQDMANGLPLPVLTCPRESRRQGRIWLDRHLGRGIRPLAIHPGSGGARKCWSARRFAEMAARMGAPVILVEGPADAEACRECAAALPPSLPCARAAGVTLSDLAGVLSECRGYLGNDSGVSHLAGALGLPTVAVFGPTDAAAWAPLGARVSAVAPQDGAAWPAVEEVFAAARRLFGDAAPGAAT